VPLPMRPNENTGAAQHGDTQQEGHDPGCLLPLVLPVGSGLPPTKRLLGGRLAWLRFAIV
jgi:hypothetical protein